MVSKVSIVDPTRSSLHSMISIIILVTSISVALGFHGIDNLVLTVNRLNQDLIYLITY